MLWTQSNCLLLPQNTWSRIWGKKMCVHVFVDDLSLFQAAVTPYWQSEPSFGSIITCLLAKLHVA